MSKTTALFITAILAVSACGTTDLQRGATGAVAGALAGEAISDEPLAGAVIGGVAGVLCDDAGVRGCQ